MIAGDATDVLLDQLVDANDRVIDNFMDPEQRAAAYAARADIFQRLRDQHAPDTTTWEGWDEMRKRDLASVERIRARLEKGR